MTHLPIWGDFKEILRVALIYLNGAVGDPGIAIILLTVLVQVLLLPLTIKQSKSMQDMQRVQPKLKELQKKYKDNKEKLQKEIMKFYSEHKVNPFGGCLPLVLQMPVFFALFKVLWEATPVQYAVLKKSSEAGKGPLRPELLSIEKLKAVVSKGSVLGISNLGDSANDVLPMTLSKLSQLKFHLNAPLLEAIPYFILIVLMAGTTYVSSKQMSMSGDPKQDRMMLFMGLFFVFIAWSFPAGVLVYWVTTNLFTMARQHFILKATKKAEG